MKRAIAWVLFRIMEISFWIASKLKVNGPLLEMIKEATDRTTRERERLEAIIRDMEASK